MAEVTPANGQDTTQGQADGPQLGLQKIYVKDISFEAPNAPQVFQDMGAAEAQPQIQLNLNQKAAALDEQTYEVVLTLTLTCTLDEKTVYLSEVQQAGIFSLSGFPDTDREAILGVYCPNTLFPYARQVVTDLIQNGGFPPYFLPPINFDALYAEQQRQQSMPAAPPANA
ncbi:MAG TPA: protein-export chaperone SecB [Mizugakiibacter sp.]|nr:protein-export chaperone SecB [Mizugakiibacter sp.]